MNGGISISHSRDESLGIIASDEWESVSVSPWPGKCLAVASNPLSCKPKIYCVAYELTTLGSSLKDLTFIIGLFGLLFTSTTGEKFQ